MKIDVSVSYHVKVQCLNYLKISSIVPRFVDTLDLYVTCPPLKWV